MANINRDFLIINDVKKSNVKLDNGSIFFYITDKNTQNIFVNLVIDISKNEKIQKFANIENAEDYTLTMNIVKPDNTYKVIEGKLHDKANAIFEFDLKSDCCDKVGTYYCELLTKCSINSREEITTSNKVTYKVKSSVLNNLDDVITEAPEYPLVVQLFDKLSDIDQYEEDRRAAELARQLAEERRQTEHAGMVSDINGRVEAVNQLIVDTKSDIDAYKEAKDTEINQAIARQDEKINQAIARQDEKINAQDTKIGTLETNDATQDLRLNSLEAKDISHEAKMRDIETKNTEQDRRLDAAENRIDTVEGRLDNIGNDITNTMQPQISSLSTRIDNVEAVNVEQNGRLDAIEIKNQQQDNRLLAIEKHDEKQDIDIKCLFSTVDTIDVTKEGNDITLQNSKLGFAVIDEIDGNTMVNCNKEADKELVLNGNINTNGYSNVTLTDGVDGGLVDVALEGNTMVNVCDQKEPVAITKSYTVETGNHVALQGEYDGKCRPVVNGNTLVNLVSREVNNQDSTLVQSTNDTSVDRIIAKYYYTYYPKHNTDYTLIFMASNVGVVGGNDGLLNISLCRGNELTARHSVLNGINIVKLNNTNTEMENTMLWLYFNIGVNCSATISNLILLEGDYTNKPIPEYFEGMQSSFEDKLVTQEMVDSGEELAENLGKYRVDYKVTGKNKFDNVTTRVSTYISSVTGEEADVGGYLYKTLIPVKPNTIYTIRTTSSTEKVRIHEFCNKTWIKVGAMVNVSGSNNITFTTSNSTNILDIRSDNENPENLQLEEGSTATAYEPYKESIKTYYLNSPLLEGDTIEQQGDNIVHVHRYEKVVLDGSEDEGWYLDTIKTNTTSFCEKNTTIANYVAGVLVYCDKYAYVEKAYSTYDKSEACKMGGTGFYINILNSKLSTIDLSTFKSYLQQNPVTVVYKLASPQYEVISQSDTILTDSYVAGHLDFDSAVPVEKVDFKYLFLELKYLYPDTTYNVQFEADNVGDAGIILGNKGWQPLGSVNKGLNKFTYITNSNPTSYMGFQGIGFNASNIVVTEATDQDFGYFEGMKSVGECEGNVIEVLSRYGNLINYIDDSHISKPIYPFSYDGLNKLKPYLIYFNLVDSYLDCNNLFDYYYVAEGTGIWLNLGTNDKHKALEVLNRRIAECMNKSNTQQLTHEPLRAVGDIKDKYVLIDGKWYIERNCASVVLDGSSDEKWSGYKEKDNTIFMENQLRLLNKATIIADKIPTSTNDDIYDLDNELIFVNATGAIQLNLTKSKLSSLDASGFKSYLQSNPITVVCQLASPTYEPIDYNPFTVYSDITHISNNSTIPANMIIKNTGYNCMLKPSTTYTVSSNQGVNVVTTPSTLTEDCLRFYDSDTSSVTTMKNVMVLEGDYTTNGKPMPSHFSGIESAFEQQYDEVVGKYKVKAIVRNEEGTKEHSIEFYINEPLRGIGDVKDKVYSDSDNIVIQRNCGVRAYQNGDLDNYLTDTVSTVYQLASPTYEVIEYPDAKLLLDIFPNSTLHYENNVPVTSTVRYTYSNPVMEQVNTVSAQVSNLSGNDVVLMSILDEEVNK